MAGETWRGFTGVALSDQDNPGTPVAATRRTYYVDPVPPRAPRETRRHRFSVRTRERVRAVTVGPYTAEYTLEQPMGAGESLEIFLAGIQGDITPTTPGGGTNTRDWAFTAADPDTTPEYQSHEVHDGAQGWLLGGCQANTIQIVGNANGTNMIRATYLCTSMAPGSMTEGLDERTPEFHEGWETAFYLDDFGQAPGVTESFSNLISWDITFNNNLARKYTAANRLAALGLRMGEFEVSARLVLEAVDDVTLDQYTNAVTPALVVARLVFGDNTIIEAALKSSITMDLAGAWSVDDLGGNDANTRTYGMTLGNIYEPTELSSSMNLVVRTDRTAAYV